MILQGLTVVALLIGVIPTRAADPDPTPTPTEKLKLLEPKPLAPNAKVVTLWPAGSPMLKALKGFDEGKADATDPIDRFSCRPDFTVLVYAGGRMDFSDIPKNAPPAFLVCAGIDDASHAAFTTKFYDAYFTAKLPVELHIYGHGGHAGGISPRQGIPFGTWHLRFIEWAKDLGYMTKAGEN